MVKIVAGPGSICDITLALQALITGVDEALVALHDRARPVLIAFGDPVFDVTVAGVTDSVFEKIVLVALTIHLRVTVHALTALTAVQFCTARYALVTLADIVVGTVFVVIALHAGLTDTDATGAVAIGITLDAVAVDTISVLTFGVGHASGIFEIIIIVAADIAGDEQYDSSE